MKKLFALVFVLAGFFASCSKESDHSYEMLKSLNGRYILTDVEWDGESFDWNRDGIKHEYLLDEMKSLSSGLSHGYICLGTPSFGEVTMMGAIPGQVGDTTNRRNFREIIAHYKAYATVAKNNNQYRFVFCFKDNSPIVPTIDTPDVPLSKYTNGVITYNNGTFNATFDAVFFDPVDWKEVSGKVTFIYTYKSEY